MSFVLCRIFLSNTDIIKTGIFESRKIRHMIGIYCTAYSQVKVSLPPANKFVERAGGSETLTWEDDCTEESYCARPDMARRLGFCSPILGADRKEYSKPT